MEQTVRADILYIQNEGDMVANFARNSYILISCKPLKLSKLRRVGGGGSDKSKPGVPDEH